MDSYRIGKIAKVTFFATALLILGLRACGDTAVRTADEGAAILRESAEGARNLAETARRVAAELVADNVDAKTAADATLRILDIVEAVDQVERAATLDNVKAALYDSTLDDVISSRNLNQLCDREARPADAPPATPIGEDIAQRLQAAGFVAPTRRDKERFLNDVAIFRKQQSICMYRDVARALAEGADIEEADAIVARYQSRDKSRPINADPVRRLFFDRDRAIAESVAAGTDESSARAQVLRYYRKAAIDLYPDLESTAGAAADE